MNDLRGKIISTRRSNRTPARFVMALDKARAEETPFPPPDISSPKSSFANFAFIKSKSETKQNHIG